VKVIGRAISSKGLKPLAEPGFFEADLLSSPSADREDAKLGRSSLFLIADSDEATGSGRNQSSTLFPR
jgi:hypothetical protein